MLASSALVPFADGQQPDRASWRAVQHTKVNHRARNNLSEPEVLSRVEAAPGVGMHALLHIDLRGEPRWSHIVGSSPEIQGIGSDLRDSLTRCDPQGALLPTYIVSITVSRLRRRRARQTRAQASVSFCST
jgi:hypothetical protein